MKDFFARIFRAFIYLIFILFQKLKDKKYSRKLSEIFINFNNKNILKKIKKIKNPKVLILLPHCLQFFECEYRVTTDIFNCRKCKKCVISKFVDIKSKFGYEIKVATGGTLARKFIKDIKPDFAIAVACERDLMSGIKDSYPFMVYGIYNEIQGEPCINTTVSIEKIYSLLEKINL